MNSVKTKFGKTISVGQKVTLGKTFGACISSEQTITEISPNGMYVKITNSTKQFSAITGNAKGAKFSWYIVY